MSNHVYGIDLGTTYSCIAYVDEYGKAVVLPNSEGDQTTPSVVYFEDDNTIVVGKAAKESSKVYPNRAVECVKREMGNPDWEFEADGRTYRPQDISALVLKKVVNDAQQNTPGGEPVKDVVITCPAYFGVNQRESTKQAGEIAGLNVLYVIPEPTAAALAYGLDIQQDQIVLVYDLGGGTFDVTLIELKEKSLHVLATDGNDQLGGKDWDGCLVESFARRFEEETGQPGSDLLSDPELYQELISDAERCKQMLSSKNSYKKNIRSGSAKATVEVLREDFEGLTDQLLQQTVVFTDRMIERAKEMGHPKIDKLLLVGGSTYMPQILDRMKQYPFEVVQFRPNLAVAEGAALFGFKFSLEDDIRRILGQDDLSKVSDADMERAQKEVAQERSLPQGRVAEIVNKEVINVSSKSFGVAVIDDNDDMKVCNLVVVGDALPARVTQRFGTRAEGQTSVEICLKESLQRNSSDELYDLSLCTAELNKGDLEFGRPLPKGAPVEITFELGPDGRLHVYIKDVTSGREKSVDVQTDGVMSREEVEKSKALVQGLSFT